VGSEMCIRDRIGTIIYNPPPAWTIGTTTISLKKSCKALIIAPYHVFFWYLIEYFWRMRIPLDANYILSRSIIKMGNIYFGPWISVRFDGISVYPLHNITRLEIIAFIINIALYK